jgi:4-hydroxybenzoate polyprenyltransferase
MQAAGEGALNDVSPLLVPDALRRTSIQQSSVATPITGGPTGASNLGGTVSALRPHQWVKNLLVFVPALAAHRISVGTLVPAAVAFVAFCLAASSVYIANDIVDLEADRAHPRKHRRPFASGELPIGQGIAMALVLCGAGVGLGATLGSRFLIVLVGYILMTSAYSLFFKRKPILDICVLATLYTARIIAGGVASEISVSMWLLAFSIFFFLSLAAVKRQAELAEGIASGSASPMGRGYLHEDYTVVSQMAIAAGYSSVLVLALYLNSPAVVPLYRDPVYLWGACLVLVFWISRMVMLGGRGLMNDDPVIFALTDGKSLFCGAVAGACFLAAILV